MPFEKSSWKEWVRGMYFEYSPKLGCVNRFLGGENNRLIQKTNNTTETRSRIRRVIF